MTDQILNKGAWFIYDGECPICTYAAHALKIKKEYGSIHLINARESAGEPIMVEINRLGMDLDEGMVIYADNHFYHGKDALKFVARYGSGNAFTALCKSLFWSNTISNVTYPWLRGARNLLLRQKNAPRIDNLDLKNEPIFKSIFGAAWDDLPIVIKKHYANRPYTKDLTIVEGELDVMCRGPIYLLSPVLKILGQIPARNEKNVRVMVRFQSEIDTKAFAFNRNFNFRDTPPYIFNSRMLQVENNEVIEIMRFGLGWKMVYSWDGNKVVLQHRGYALSLFGHLMPVPLTALLGKGYAEEIPIDDETFDMVTHITHPWWGKIYEYKGRFKIIGNPQ